MEVYIEVTYILNFFVLFLSFELLCFLLNYQMTIKQLIIYCVVYNISVFLLYVDVFVGFLLLYDLIVTFLFFRKRFYMIFPVFMFIYVSIISFSQLILSDTIVFQGILIIEKMNVNIMILLLMMFLLAIYFYISFVNYQLKQNSLVQVSFDHVSTVGFVDNGNQVFYRGQPVIFISEKYAEMFGVIDTMNVFTAFSKDQVNVTKLKQIEINFQTFYNVYAAYMSESEYDVILNSNLMGGFI